MSEITIRIPHGSIDAEGNIECRGDDNGDSIIITRSEGIMEADGSITPPPLPDRPVDGRLSIRFEAGA